MAKIVNNDKLILILTQYGLERIAAALESSSVEIEITKIRIGSGNNFEYYEPVLGQTELKGDLGYEFPVLEKNLLEDDMTISFRTIINENVGGIDIREVGLYETINGEDKLFAISTQQPFVKPSIDDNYLISMDYYIFLKITNVQEIYNQIVLSPENRIITEPDFEELMRTITFADGNLINQIGNNSRIIGYNRATQLYEKIQENKRNFSYITTYNNYATLLEFVNPSNVMAYWVFNYSRHNDLRNSIPDISRNLINLSTNKEISSYEKDYQSFMSTFKFEAPDYFYLSSEIPFSLLTEEMDEDSPFTMMFVLSPLSTDSKRTLLAKSNYASDLHTFEVNELPDGSVEVKLFQDSSNYLTFTSQAGIIPSNGFHSLIISYIPDATTPSMTAYVSGNKYVMELTKTGDYIRMSSPLSTLFAFTCIPTYSIYTNSSTNPTELYNADGSPDTSGSWEITEGKVMFGDLEAIYTPTSNVDVPTLYAWTYNDGIYDHTIYTKELAVSTSTTLYYGNYSPKLDTDTNFAIVQSGSQYIIQYQGHNTTYDALHNISTHVIYCWKATGNSQVIWANASSSPLILYNSNGSPYEGTSWTISGGNVFYEGMQAQYSSQDNISLSILALTSYIIDSSNNRTQFINSKVGVISVVKENLIEDKARTLSLLLESTLGNNLFINRS